MRLSTLVLGIFVWSTSSTGFAAVIFYTDLPTFDSASSTTLVEDFESFSPKNTRLSSFTSNGITYTGFAGTPSPNVFVSAPGFTNFGVPVTTSSILTANGDEDFTLDFSTPTTAVGFDTYLNQFGPADVKVFGSSGLLGAFSLLHDPTLIGFLGITSTENITSLRWTTVDGGVINTGIDNIRTGVGVVPLPPALWLFGTALMGLIGFGKRRKAA